VNHDGSEEISREEALTFARELIGQQIWDVGRYYSTMILLYMGKQSEFAKTRRDGSSYMARRASHGLHLHQTAWRLIDQNQKIITSEADSDDVGGSLEVGIETLRGRNVEGVSLGDLMPDLFMKFDNDSQLHVFCNTVGDHGYASYAISVREACVGFGPSSFYRYRQHYPHDA
jgi:hypothetical protein